MQGQIFHTYGIPEVLVSDNGSQFKANDFNAFLANYGVNHVYTALYSPQSNASERVNRSIIAAIRAYLKRDHRDWDENITSISCALRNALYQSIGTNPYRVLYGFNMATNGSSYKLMRSTNLLCDGEISVSHKDYLTLLRDEVQKHLQKAYNTNVIQYNLRTRPISFSVGETVFRRNFAQSDAEKKFNAKLSPIFVKAKVKEKVGNCYYVLEDDDGKFGTYHAKDIRK